MLLGCCADPGLFLPPAAAAALGTPAWEEPVRDCQDVLPSFFAVALALWCFVQEGCRSLVLQWVNLKGAGA